MRSTLLLAALAVGSCAKVIEKEVYVTDWTTETVTTTVTSWPTTTPNTVNNVKQDTVAAVAETAAAESSSSSSSTTIESTTTSALPTVDLTKKTTALPAAPTDAEVNLAGATTWFSTSYWSIPAEPATTETPTSLSTSTSAAAAATPTNAYQETILYNHNVHRSNHSASSVTWSGSLESSARTLAERCVYQHDTSIAGGGYGQNIGYGVGESSIGEMITNLMYNDEMMFFADLYGKASPDMSNFDAWGHFSQIVWKGTEEVGCATVVCPSLGNAGGSNVPFTVCNYSPAGNYDGEYADNVLSPQGATPYTA
ncbi:unnamed protein product [Penicillium olsonii]|uniref:SCP domain-containing protein n=1 Tax=Penicillium olsonii TaxID=99116 RepID=A0A9W4HQ97_PENOL|nr:unnamed protein product [Penicillium olsonii]CAG7916854.1 unnamed protein product [Penicillium olsonii]CAG8088376.1 unnamed protein product [Penicillium olsonii]CAG8092083.1 unnamed protein product [Penicillium olsonii]